MHHPSQNPDFFVYTLPTDDDDDYTTPPAPRNGVTTTNKCQLVCIACPDAAEDSVVASFGKL